MDLEKFRDRRKQGVPLPLTWSFDEDVELLRRYFDLVLHQEVILGRITVVMDFDLCRAADRTFIDWLLLKYDLYNGDLKQISSHKQCGGKERLIVAVRGATIEEIRYSMDIGE